MAARPRTLPAAIAPGAGRDARPAIEVAGELPRRRAPSSPPWSAASSSRSGPTSPTTTRTPSAAPTPSTGSGRSGSPPPGWSRRGSVLVATWVAFAVAVACGHLSGHRGRAGDPRGRGRLDPRRRPLHRRAAALRLRGARRAVRLPLLRPGRRQRLLLRPARGARLAAASASRSRSAAWPRRSSSSTTSATSTPTAAPASEPSPSASGASATRRLYVALVGVAYAALPVTLLADDGPWWAAARVALAAARAPAAPRRCSPAPTARR